MNKEECDEIIDALAEEFEKYPFDSYSGIEVAEIISGYKK